MSHRRVGFFLLLFWWISATANSKTLSQALGDNSLKTKYLGNLTVRNVSAREGSELSFKDISVDDGKGGRIVLEIVSPMEKAAAIATAELQREVLVNAYENHLTPYAGEATNTVSCPAKLKPTQFALTSPLAIDSVVIGRANGRFTWGYCGNARDTTIGANAYLYVESKKQLIRVTYFQPEKKYSKQQVTDFLSGIGPTDGR